MKVFYNLILILFLSINLSQSQTGWVLQQSNTGRDLNNILFLNVMTGWCVGDSNNILRTTNGGSEWTVQFSPGSVRLFSVYFININTGWCSGGITDPVNHGVIYKTTNSGINWFTIYNLGWASINDIYFIDENTGFRAENTSSGFSSQGAISKTTNGGINWLSNLSYNQYVYTAIKFKNSNTGWATGYWWSDVGGDSTLILKTTNGGNNWFVQFRERGGRPVDISYNNDHLWVAGKDSVILFSSDAGDNWVKQNTNTGKRFNSVFFLNENTGWAAGFRYPDTTNIIKTTNGGMNWFNLKNNYFNTLNSVFFINEHTGWSAGSSGVILKTTTGGLTFVNNNTSQIPIGFILHQNYPNPFNPVTVIRYTIQSDARGYAANVKLVVYDNLGKEITTLVKEKQAAGNYEVILDGENLSSGIYFYKLEADNFADTKRMVLLR